MKHELITDKHLTLEHAKSGVLTALMTYTSHEKAMKIMERYSPEVLRETAAILRCGEAKAALNIPSIETKEVDTLDARHRIRDVRAEEYASLPYLMGMLVHCCAYAGGTGSLLCRAAQNSPWFKIILTEKQQMKKGRPLGGWEVTGLTVVCAGEEGSLVILGFEATKETLSNGEKQRFKEFLEYAASEMLKDSRFTRVLFSAGGKGLPNIGFGSKSTTLNAKTYEELEALVALAGFTPMSLGDSKNDIKIIDGVRFGFASLSEIPESAVCAVFPPQPEVQQVVVFGVANKNLNLY